MGPATPTLLIRASNFLVFFNILEKNLETISKENLENLLKIPVADRPNWSVEEIVKELDLESHIEFLGNLPQSKIRELLNRSKLLIHTSEYETFGLVAIEAHSVGVPVVSINQGSFKEIIDNNMVESIFEERSK